MDREKTKNRLLWRQIQCTQWAAYNFVKKKIIDTWFTWNVWTVPLMVFNPHPQTQNEVWPLDRYNLIHVSKRSPISVCRSFTTGSQRWCIYRRRDYGFFLCSTPDIVARNVPYEWAAAIHLLYHQDACVKCKMHSQKNGKLLIKIQKPNIVTYSNTKQMPNHQLHQHQ